MHHLKHMNLRELLTPVIRKGRVRVLGRVRNAPRGHDNAASAKTEVNSKSLKNIGNYNVFCKVDLPKTVISMKNIRNYTVFSDVGLPKALKSMKNCRSYNAFDDLACLATLRPTKRSPGAPQEHPKASQDPFKPPILYIETPDQPQSGRYWYDCI